MPLSSTNMALLKLACSHGGRGGFNELKIAGPRSSRSALDHGISTSKAKVLAAMLTSIMSTLMTSNKALFKQTHGADLVIKFNKAPKPGNPLIIIETIRILMNMTPILLTKSIKTFLGQRALLALKLIL
jgi:hypothetical protein